MNDASTDAVDCMAAAVNRQLSAFYGCPVIGAISHTGFPVVLSGSDHAVVASGMEVPDLVGSIICSASDLANQLRELAKSTRTTPPPHQR